VQARGAQPLLLVPGEWFGGRKGPPGTERRRTSNRESTKDADKPVTEIREAEGRHMREGRDVDPR